MTEQLHLIGVVDTTVEWTEEFLGQGFESVAASEVIGVVHRQPSGQQRYTKASVGKRLLEHQRMLESLLKLTPFIPAQPDLVFDDKAELAHFLDEAGDRLPSLHAQYGKSIQYQVIISWDPQLTLKRLADTEEGVKLSRRLAELPSRQEKGAEIQRYMEGLRQDLAQRFFRSLEAVCQSTLQLPVGDEAHIFNATALIDRDGESTLETALEELDAAHPGLRIQMIGPLPAVSFASIGRNPGSTDDLREASALLGVDETVSHADLRSAWLQQAKNHHPDKGFATGLMARINSAYDALSKATLQGRRWGQAAQGELVVQKDSELSREAP